ncbi:MAG: transketolase [Phycisphaerales bacterium]
MQDPNAGTPAGTPVIDRLAINTLRTLAMDAVQAANSGHPGAPMGLAPVGYALWQDALVYDPAAPHWPNRDRFVLSNGHACMLLYGLLHLAGVQETRADGSPAGRLAVSMDDLRAFRQPGSRCPGHPEFGITPGVETTTGPLGQGLGNSVGMAIAGKFLAERYNTPGFTLFDHHVWAICGDGCLMEGISHEAASAAGHLKLGNLCWIFDSNSITIDGSTGLSCSDYVDARFHGYGWNVQHVRDANDLAALREKLSVARGCTDRPTIVVVASHIGWGSPEVQDKAKAHGEPLGEHEVARTKAVYGWPTDAKFLVPDGVRERFAEGVGARGKAAHAKWQETWTRYRAAHPELAQELETMWRGELPAGWDAGIPTFKADPKGEATRSSGGTVLNSIMERVPWMLGGSADLTPSNKTALKGAGTFNAPEFGGSYAGRNMHFGIREHAMGAMVNGMALSGLRAFGAGFMIFTDYMRTPIRLSAFMKLPCLWVMTHDSIGVGEDGPTHQPIEQLAGLRAVPNLAVWRPADGNEAAEAYRWAMSTRGTPSVMALTRQNVPTFDRTRCTPAEGTRRGGYVLLDAEGGAPQVILMASGSEVSLCVEAHAKLAAQGVRARVVSMPCTLVFDRQPQEYRDAVLPPAVRRRVAVEMASPLGWGDYVGLDGTVIAMRTFGESGPAPKVIAHFGFTVDRVVEAATR